MAQGYQVEEVPDNVVPLQPSIADKAMVFGVTMGLKALGEGAAIALSNIAAHTFSLLTVGSAFWLWMSIPDPNNNQIVWTGMYAVFVLAANVIVRRK